MKIIELKTEKEIEQSYETVKGLYDIPKEIYVRNVQNMQKSDYTLLACLNSDNKIVALVGYRIGLRLYCGKYLHIDNLIVEKEYRSKGFAKFVISHLKDIAKQKNCVTILADSYLNNSRAQKLFINNGFYIRGFHMKYDF